MGRYYLRFLVLYGITVGEVCQKRLVISLQLRITHSAPG